MLADGMIAYSYKTAQFEIISLHMQAMEST